MDEAWRAHRKLLKSEGLDQEQISIAQESFKDGWAECEKYMKAIETAASDNK